MHTAPAAPRAPFDVLISGDPPDIPTRIDHWSPRGSLLPQPGDACLVVPDDEGHLWLAEWEPQANDPGGGAPGASYDVRHVQSVPSATWVIDWPAERVVPPRVTTVIGGVEVYADVLYDEALRRVTVTFDGAATGVAYLT